MSPAELKHKLDKRKSERYYTDPRRIEVGPFFNNPLIRYMATFPNWTMSDKKKMPLDANYYIKNRETSTYPFRAFRYTRDDDGNVKVRNGIKQTDALVQLYDLDPKHTPELDFVNRAYRMDAREDRVICIDIESTCVVDHPDIVNTLWTLPATYRERSMHDGYHLLLYLPQDFINSKNRYILHCTNIKGPQNLFEFIDNKHFVTLTHKMTTQVNCPMHQKRGHKYYTYSDPKQRKALKKFIAQLVEFDRPAEAKRRIQDNLDSSEFDVHFSPEDLLSLPDWDKKLAKEALPRLNAHFAGRKLKEDDYKDDLSRYELAVVSRIKWWLEFQLIIGYLHYFAEDNLTHVPNQEDVDLITANLAFKQLTQRKKWKSKRRGLPWLLYYSADISNAKPAIEKAREIKKLKRKQFEL